MLLKPLQIGPHTLAQPIALAPMAGVTDKPFRRLSREFGAGYGVSEMLSSRPELRQTRTSRHRCRRSCNSGRYP